MLSIVYLLRAFWILATLPIVIAVLPFPKLATYREVVNGFSRRGKTVLQSSSHIFSVPQKYFCHFYVLGVFWTTFLLVGFCLCACGILPIVSEGMSHSSIASQMTGSSSHLPLQKYTASTKEHKNGIWNSVFLLLLMEAQVLRRLFESLFVFKYSPSARMHIVAYLTGIFFYTAAPLSLCCEYASEVFNFAVNGYAEFIIKGKDVIQIKECESPLMFLRWYTWLGAACFLWGWMHQLRCHAILGSLRKNGGSDQHYAIPCGDWFNYVSSPHYLAEIVIYSGLVIANGFSDVTMWLLCGFVVVNLGLAADETHKWYIRKFDNYPRYRCAFLPFFY